MLQYWQVMDSYMHFRVSTNVLFSLKLDVFLDVLILIWLNIGAVDNLKYNSKLGLIKGTFLETWSLLDIGIGYNAI